MYMYRQIWMFAQGEDARLVVPYTPPKRMSAEVCDERETFPNFTARRVCIILQFHIKVGRITAILLTV
jgi:hypothetical protein